MSHRPYASDGHGFLARENCVRLGIPDEQLPPGDEIALIMCRDAITGERCTHFGDAEYLRAFLIWVRTFGAMGTVNDEGMWVGNDLPGFRIHIEGHPNDWVAEMQAASAAD